MGLTKLVKLEIILGLTGLVCCYITSRPPDSIINNSLYQSIEKVYGRITGSQPPRKPLYDLSYLVLAGSVAGLTISLASRKLLREEVS